MNLFFVEILHFVFNLFSKMWLEIWKWILPWEMQMNWLFEWIVKMWTRVCFTKMFFFQHKCATLFLWHESLNCPGWYLCWVSIVPAEALVVNCGRAPAGIIWTVFAEYWTICWILNPSNYQPYFSEPALTPMSSNQITEAIKLAHSIGLMDVRNTVKSF